MKKLLLALSLILAISTTFGQSKWVTGYFPTWWYGTKGLDAYAINWQYMTHVVIFPAQDALSTSPYFNVSDLDNNSNLSAYINAAHAKNVKVLISIVGGYGQTVIPVVALDAVKCSTFVSTACAWVKAHNGDGIELDWEFPRSATEIKGWNQLVTILRSELDKWNPKGILGTSANYLCMDYCKNLTIMSKFDQINIMSYTMWMGKTQSGPYYSGYDTPVNDSPLNPYGTSLSSPATVQTYLDAGYKPSQIGIGIPFESTWFTSSGLGKSYSAWNFGSVASSTPSQYLPVPTSGRKYDAIAQAAYCISGGKVYSYQDTNSVKAITSWAKVKGFNIMIWDFPCGYDNTANPKDVLLRTVANTFNVPANPPVDTTTPPVVVPPIDTVHIVCDTLKILVPVPYAVHDTVLVPRDTMKVWNNAVNATNAKYVKINVPVYVIP